MSSGCSNVNTSPCSSILIMAPSVSGKLCKPCSSGTMYSALSAPSEEDQPDGVEGIVW